MEMFPEPVEEMVPVQMECGVVQLLVVKVSSIYCLINAWSSIDFFAAYTCTSLSAIPNGAISYFPDTTSPFDFGTVAMYTCDQGFVLGGASTRTCLGSGTSGYWDGTAPECIGIALSFGMCGVYYLVHLQQLYVPA